MKLKTKLKIIHNALKLLAFVQYFKKGYENGSYIN